MNTKMIAQKQSINYNVKNKPSWLPLRDCDQNWQWGDENLKAFTEVCLVLPIKMTGPAQFMMTLQKKKLIGVYKNNRFLNFEK
jgi:hypothetical protein